MDRHEAKLRELLMMTPSEKWPQLAKAMAWERGTNGPPWMDAKERDWFWDTIDREQAAADKRTAQEVAWEQAKADLMAPFVRVVDWLAARLR